MLGKRLRSIARIARRAPGGLTRDPGLVPWESASFYVVVGTQGG